MMNRTHGTLQTLVSGSLECLLGLYPARFRSEFAGEIRHVFLQRVDEAGRKGGAAWFLTASYEILSLGRSVIQESWHELWIRKGENMEEETIAKDTGGGGAVLQQVGFPTSKPPPGLFWVAGWILLTTLVYPAAVFMSSWFSMPFLWLSSLGVRLGLWPTAGMDILGVLGFTASLAITMAAVQALLVRRLLLRPWRWFAATAGGILCTGLVYLGLAQTGLTSKWDSLWDVTLILLLEGTLLGTAQWLYLRKPFNQAVLPNSAWWIPINILGTTSVLLSYFAITVYFEPKAFFFLALPGVFTGVGLWLLLRQAHQGVRTEGSAAAAPSEASLGKAALRRRLALVGLGLAALVPLFFFSLWAYAASQLALSKNDGVFPTIEDAVVGRAWQDWGGAKVVGVENFRAGPNWRDGTQPHVWFATATIKLDRVPEGHTRPEYMTGSYYIHVRDGWVHMSEGAFPEFVGWVMELYNLEGARDFEP